MVGWVIRWTLTVNPASLAFAVRGLRNGTPTAPRAPRYPLSAKVATAVWVSAVMMPRVRAAFRSRAPVAPRSAADPARGARGRPAPATVPSRHRPCTRWSSGPQPGPRAGSPRVQGGRQCGRRADRRVRIHEKACGARPQLPKKRDRVDRSRGSAISVEMHFEIQVRTRAAAGRGPPSTRGRAVVRGVPGDSEDADYGRVEVEGFGSHLCEAGDPEQVCDLAGGVERGVPCGSWAAGLGGDGDASAGCESSA